MRAPGRAGPGRPLRVVVLGGYGLFGRRLCARLALRTGLHLWVAGRDAAKAGQVVSRLAPSACASLQALSLDAQASDLTARLKVLQADVLVHAAGPFQGQAYDVARACIAARLHYIDLADGRDFVSGIGVLDAAARQAGVAVLSGASSVPALSSAVVDVLVEGLLQVDLIDIGISPGNRTERGLSTLQAVLSYCGQALPPFHSAPRHGWSGSWRHRYPAPVGERLLSPCDVPDLTLLPARYAGQPAVRFGAGLELRLLHRGMNLMAWMTRRGFVRDWQRFSPLLWRVAEACKHWGSDAGAMHVAVQGRLASGEPVQRQWSLVAAQDHGPYVPTLAASALVRRLQQGLSLPPGAQPCVGVLTLQDFGAEVEGLQIRLGA